MEGPPRIEPLRYAVPWDLVFGLAPHLANRTRRDIFDFTRAIVERMQPPPVHEGLEHIPATAPFVLVANHYQRKGLWILHTAAALTQAIARVRGPADPPVRWMVTANWPPWRLGSFSIPSPGDRLLPRVAEALQCYPVSFSGTNPAYTAGTLRRLLKDARVSATPIGIFPEGVAGAAGSLTKPLAGVDRVLDHLRRPVLPCAVSENGGFVLRFGPLIPPEAWEGQDAAQVAMAAVGALMRQQG
jgi:1-acyl-sn-glycerol-3-phosphate acyltransferase